MSNAAANKAPARIVGRSNSKIAVTISAAITVTVTSQIQRAGGIPEAASRSPTLAAKALTIDNFAIAVTRKSAASPKRLIKRITRNILWRLIRSYRWAQRLCRLPCGKALPYRPCSLFMRLRLGMCWGMASLFFPNYGKAEPFRTDDGKAVPFPQSRQPKRLLYPPRPSCLGQRWSSSLNRELLADLPPH